MIICVCRNVTEQQILDAAANHQELLAGDICKKCIPFIEKLHEKQEAPNESNTAKPHPRSG